MTYKILIKYENKIANLWQVYGTSTTIDGVNTFTEFETDDVSVLEAEILKLDGKHGHENIRVVSEAKIEYLVDVTV